MRVIEPCASACSTVAIWPSGTLTTVPTGSVRSVSTDVTWSGSRRTTIAVVPFSSGSWTWVAVVPTRAPADLLRDLGGREADEDRLVRIGRDADLRRALRQVGLEVEQLVVVRERREDGVVGLLDRRGVVARDDDVEAVRREPGRLGDRDVVAVGLDRRELVREVDRVRGEVDVRREAHGHPGAVGRPAARGGDDGLEARLALAGDAGLDQLHLGIGRAGSSRPRWPARAPPATRRRPAGRP